MRAKSLMSFILIMWTVPALAQTTGTDPDSIPFAAPVHYDAGRLPHHIFCANLDGDSYPDIAVADWADANVSVLINNGDGTFQPKQDYPVTCGPYSVFPGDLDGDSDLDLALPNFCSNTISILKNNGDGTFQA
ncbi:MAG: VCBS repeat-containing protein, partial [candidate division Zixibacteria bacterium]|nr:VCBS repeat-containing protein [candidate division Zixibacteria bacterium]